MNCQTVNTKTEPEVIVIDDEDNTVSSLPTKSLLPASRAKIRHHKKTKRKVKMARNKDMETLIVTQEVKIKEQKIQCIINLTNICEHAQKEKVIKTMKNPLKTKTPLERIVPHCSRDKCQTQISTKCCRQKEDMARRKERLKCKKLKRKREKERPKQVHHARKKEPYVVRTPDHYLSPISLSPLKTPKSTLSFEDISSDSFTTSSDQNIDLDTLIKRTKDRERKLNKSHEYFNTKGASISKQESFSDTETMYLKSDGDMSHRSTATLVLEPCPELYSPAYPTYSPENSFENFMEKNNNCKYSPPIHHEGYNVEFEIKKEKNIFQYCSMENTNPYETMCTKFESSTNKIEKDLISNTGNDKNVLSEDCYRGFKIKTEILSSPINYTPEDYDMATQYNLKSQGYSPAVDCDPQTQEISKIIKIEENL